MKSEIEKSIYKLTTNAEEAGVSKLTRMFRKFCLFGADIRERKQNKMCKYFFFTFH